MFGLVNTLNTTSFMHCVYINNKDTVPRLSYYTPYLAPCQDTPESPPENATEKLQSGLISTLANITTIHNFLKYTGIK